MKKRYYFKTTAMLTVMFMMLLSSCLKDSRYVDFPNAGNVANMPNSGLNYFGADAVLADTTQFGVDYATANPNPAVTITLAVDPTIVASYVAAHPAIQYQQLPTADYKLSTTTVNIPAGAQYQIVTLVVNRAALDPTVSYMLPVKIASTSAGIISANSSIHYFHIIGNDFAGTYLHDYTRVPAAGNFVGGSATFFPDNPNQFEVMGGYFTGTIRYVVTFQKTGSGASATYSNFTIALNPDDVANIVTPAGITVVQQPIIQGYVAGTQYTYSQVVHGLLSFNWTTTTRNITDFYYKP